MYREENTLRCYRIFTSLEKVENVDLLFSVLDMFFENISKQTYFHSYFLFSLKMKTKNT